MGVSVPQTQRKHGYCNHQSSGYKRYFQTFIFQVMESDSSERKWNVTTHLDTKHPICPICFSRLTSLKNMLKHIYEKHTNNKLIPEEYENTEDSDEDDDGMIVVRRYSNNVKLKKTKVTLTEDTKIKVDGKPKTLIAGGKILLSRKME